METQTLKSQKAKAQRKSEAALQDSPLMEEVLEKITAGLEDAKVASQKYVGQAVRYARANPLRTALGVAGVAALAIGAYFLVGKKHNK